jgi:galactokinase
MLFVPGRLCLFGEHADWAGGYRRTHPEIAAGQCLVVGTDQGLSGDFEAREDGIELTSILADGRRMGPERIEVEPKSLRRVAEGGGFFSYAAGVALEIAERFGPHGLALELRTDLPIRKGLSSSAALSVLVARSFGRAHGLALTVRDEMEIAYAGERRAGSACGRMDQICAFGRRPTYLRFDGERMEIEPLSAQGELHMLVVDLRRGKDTRRILAALNRCFPDARGPLAEGVREALGRVPRSSKATLGHSGRSWPRRNPSSIGWSDRLARSCGRRSSTKCSRIPRRSTSPGEAKAWALRATAVRSWSPADRRSGPSSRGGSRRSSTSTACR